ncbi:hypothetical protein SteCoe_16042 [Stentor coeruleus]|uniref:Uncharacterized protein n=1 Tax=Stentor coeruleus TaxID=5963 RepID=A0A1R2C2B6_9CILI|nr:hypothetical protein SteCoe_16042 [Stentor coeruleus]
MQEVSANLSNEYQSFILNKTFKRDDKDMDISSLKSRIEDLQTNLKLNKQIVNSLVFSKTNDSFEDTAAESVGSPKAIEQLMSEIRILEDQVEKTIEERNELQIRNLLNEQIYNEFSLRHQEIINDYKEQTSELQFQNDRKNKIIEDLSNLNSVLKSEASIANKSKFIIQVKPNVNVLDMYSKIEEIRELIQERAREIYFFETHKNELEELKGNLIKGIIKIQALVINPVNRKANAEKNRNLEGFDFISDKALPQLDLSQIERDFMEIENPDEEIGINQKKNQIAELKEDFEKKSRKLKEISEENLKQHKVNCRLLMEKEKLDNRIDYMQKGFFDDLTTEIKNDYENALCYKIKPSYLDSISEIEVNHSHFYESSKESIASVE